MLGGPPAGEAGRPRRQLRLLQRDAQRLGAHGVRARAARAHVLLHCDLVAPAAAARSGTDTGAALSRVPDAPRSLPLAQAPSLESLLSIARQQLMQRSLVVFSYLNAMHAAHLARDLGSAASATRQAASMPFIKKRSRTPQNASAGRHT